MIEQAINYNGSWEKKGRNINAAAVAGLLGIGVFYFNGQTIVAIIGIVFVNIITPGLEASGNFMKRLTASITLYAAPLRIAVVVSQYLFMLLPALWLVKRWHTKNVREYIRLNRCSILEIILAVLATITIIPFGTYISNELIRWLKIPNELLKINAELFTAYSLKEFIWLVFVVAITPAICEEIFFRGYGQRTFERTIKAKSVIVVGILFGLFHLQPLGLVTLSLLGILFCYFYYKSKSLLPSIAAHFSNNFLAIMVLYKSPQIGDLNLETANQIPFSWVLVTLPISIGILYLYPKAVKQHISDSKKAKTYTELQR